MLYSKDFFQLIPVIYRIIIKVIVKLCIFNYTWLSCLFFYIAQKNVLKNLISKSSVHSYQSHIATAFHFSENAAVLDLIINADVFP